MASSHDKTLEFPSFPTQNFTLLGDSYLRHDVAGLTLESNLLASSSGTIIYTTPVRFSINRTNSPASFSTRLSFSIVNGLTFFILPENRTLCDSYLRHDVAGLTLESNLLASSSETIMYTTPVRFSSNRANSLASFSTRFSFSIVNGITFLISAENLTLGSPGGYLGVVDGSRLTKNNFIAIENENDTHLDDPNSIKRADCMETRIDLRNGSWFSSWIDLAHGQKNLKVLLRLEMDYFQEHRNLGFASATTGVPMMVLSVVVSSIKQYEYPNLIQNCKLQSYGIEYLNPVNITDERIIVVSFIKHSLIGLGLGVLVFILGYVSAKKWRGKILGFFEQQFPKPVSLHDIDYAADPVSKHPIPNPSPPSLTSSVTKQGHWLDLDSSKQREVSLHELQTFFSFFLAIFLMSSALQLQGPTAYADVAADDDDDHEHEQEATSTVAVDDVATVDGDDADVALAYEISPYQSSDEYTKKEKKELDPDTFFSEVEEVDPEMLFSGFEGNYENILSSHYEYDYEASFSSQEKQRQAEGLGWRSDMMGLKALHAARVAKRREEKKEKERKMKKEAFKIAIERAKKEEARLQELYEK